MPWAAWKASTMGMIVVVSARLPSKAADLERKTAPVNQQPDDDLRIDPTLLGVTHPPQIILTLGLEVQDVHACRHRARPPLAVTCSNRA